MTTIEPTTHKHDTKKGEQDIDRDMSPFLHDMDAKKPKRPPKLTIKLGLFEISITLLIAMALAIAVRFFFFQIVTVDGISMEGTLLNSERVAVVMFDYWLSEPKRGDVVLCKYPERKDSFIKRVLALPGEMIMLRNGIVYVDGRALAEQYIMYAADEDFGPTIVPMDSYFVMGDNRPESGDSRLASVGPLPRSYIKGRATALLEPLQKFFTKK